MLGALQVCANSRGNSPGSARATQAIMRANLRVRQELSKLFPALVAPPLSRLASFNDAQQRATRFDDLYQSAVRRADRTTAMLCCLVGAAAVVLTLGAVKIVQTL